MNTKFYKEFQDKYPTILGSDRNISYTQFLEEMVTELQQQVKLFAIPVVSNQRELLIAYENKVGHMDRLDAENFVDKYLNDTAIYSC